MATFRMGRINKELLREIVHLLEFEIEDETAKHAVITSVECSRDLKHAHVWFTALCSEQREPTLEALKKVAPALRKMMGVRMHLHTTPELEFKLDTSEDYGRKIDSLLDSLGCVSKDESP